MAELKREYVVPLRRKTKLAPKWRRSKKAVSVLKEFIQKHMKTDHVIICEELNEKIWEHGIKNPPGKVNVIALKTQIAGVEKTLVNLIEIGVDEHLKKYATETPQVVEETKEKPKKEKKTTKETKAQEEKIQDAEVKEVAKEEKESKKEAKENE